MNKPQTSDGFEVDYRGDRKGILPFSIAKFSALLLLFALIVILSGCTTRYYPQPTDRVSIVDNYALIEIDNSVLAITPRFWTREPQRLAELFTTYHIIIRNQSPNTITISPADIVLLDEETNQYDAMTASDVSEILFYNEFWYDNRFSPFPERTDTFSTGDKLAARGNLMQDAFHYGEILPGARKSGFIFFSKLPARNRRSTIVFKGEEIVFIRR
jgi:hypothetical protein